MGRCPACTSLSTNRTAFLMTYGVNSWRYWAGTSPRCLSARGSQSERSQRIFMPIASVVADANVLLSAVVGKAALRVFTKFTVTVHVAQFNADEVTEYLPYMASKYELPLELVKMQWK